MKTIAKRIQIDPVQPAREPLLQAARAISAGRLVVFPTSGLYGLAADALDPVAVDKIFAAKGRSPDKPVLILVRSRDELTRLVAAVPAPAELLMDNVWPGGLTLVFQAAALVPTVLTAGSGKIGIRLPAHPVARALVAAVGRPITGTSANVSGRTGCSRIAALDAAIAGAADMTLDAGDLAGGVGSTVVDVTRQPPVILRSGAVPEDIVRQVLAAD